MPLQRHCRRLAPITAALRRRAPTIAMIVLAAIVIVHGDPAFAQADPFATAKAKACEVQQAFKTFTASVGMVGMICCLMLGYFNKLNWRWLATGIGVSFAVNVVPTFVMRLGGGGC